MLELPSQFPVIASQLEAQGGVNPWSTASDWEDTARTVANLGIGASTPGGTSLTAQFPLRQLVGGTSPMAMLRNEVPTSLLRGDWLRGTNVGEGLELGPGV